ncbi:nuclear transport factor 2 family protein [Saccharopolyspora gloriosae]|uniref:nuclear transport factor 2 family protein n=1 Tax=Saccharopolyspora gloriosae TaxID=455344 RepID=UPI001FB63E21|nr:nuclear transport factor 2 family protein [Saccharopolyspora gloriosae]
MEQNISEKVESGLRLLESYDFTGFRAMCTSGCTLWENDGNGEQTIEDRMVQFKSFVAGVDSLRYEVLRRFEKADEVLQQHVLHVALADGTHNQVNAAVYFRFADGLIDRIEEYGYAVPADPA